MANFTPSFVTILFTETKLSIVFLRHNNGQKG